MICINRLYTTLGYQTDQHNLQANLAATEYDRPITLGARAMHLNQLFNSLLAAYASGK
ncbi:hypothetical protein C4J88_0548 [Pseudomonas sp. R4-39-08]|uniref:hypothetical protein n=1 Tax=Pseudomonas sp. R4-39-08 TaxID=1173288 RepID=UPI000F6B5702|nr:hypothetical protein [Pseudomonas sp. R4-39-08]AZF35359.1 hypothetical protein C4J88_0548 [Pseudomonas sp. R4-39-08]